MLVKIAQIHFKIKDAGGWSLCMRANKKHTHTHMHTHTKNTLKHNDFKLPVAPQRFCLLYLPADKSSKKSKLTLFYVSTY